MLRLTKFHGLGNDFLIALAADHPDAEHPLTPDPDVARALCARHTGIGADGLIYGLAPGGDEADVHMVLLNADGSEAEISGNGIRCLAQAVLRHEGRDEGDVLVETAGGVRHLRTVKGSVDGELWIQVDMGEPSDGPVPSAEAQEVSARARATVDIGNPHLVLLVDDLDDLDLSEVGPRVEESFDAGINVHGVVVDSAQDLRLRVWERGVGLTQACGSGAVAAAVAAHAGRPHAVFAKTRHGDREVEVVADGGAPLAGRPVVLVDDIASSGRTLAQAARACLAAGARTVDAMVTHALCRGDDLAALHAAGVGRLWSTDSLEHPSNRIALAPLLAQGLREHGLA